MSKQMTKGKKLSVTGATTQSGARAVHADAGDMHFVALKDIRVFLVPDGERSWYAQALDLDYAAGGNTIEEAKGNFETGLTETICEHLKYFGNIKGLLRPAPPEDWTEYMETPAESMKRYSTITIVELLERKVAKRKSLQHFPFTEITFLTRGESERVSA